MAITRSPPNLTVHKIPLLAAATDVVLLKTVFEAAVAVVLVATVVPVYTKRKYIPSSSYRSVVHTGEY
jgi:hypothetical protein